MFSHSIQILPMTIFTIVKVAARVDVELFCAICA